MNKNETKTVIGPMTTFILPKDLILIVYEYAPLPKFPWIKHYKFLFDHEVHDPTIYQLYEFGFIHMIIKPCRHIQQIIHEISTSKNN